MDQRELQARISQLDEPAIRAAAAALRAATSSAADEVAWWRATLVIERELRHAHALTVAAMVSHQAAAAVTARAEQLGVVLPDPDVTTVARAAAEAARALVAGGRAADDAFACLGHGFAPARSGSAA